MVRDFSKSVVPLRDVILTVEMIESEIHDASRAR